MWVVYDSPQDYPGKFVARLWLNNEPQESITVSENLDTIQSFMRQMHLYRLDRMFNDDPVIVEMWL